MGLRFYSVHAEPWNPATTPQGADRTVMVKEGSFLAGFPDLAALADLASHVDRARALSRAGDRTAALSEFGQVPDQAMAIASLVIALVLGLEGNSLRRWTLARRGYEEIGEVAAETPQAAEMRFFERRGHRTADAGLHDRRHCRLWFGQSPLGIEGARARCHFVRRPPRHCRHRRP